MVRRSLPLVIAAAVLLAACGATGNDDPAGAAPDGTDSSDATVGDTTVGDAAAGDTTAGDPDVPFSVDQVQSSPRDVTDSGIDIWRSRIVPEASPEPLIDLDEIGSGGPPPDGIPPVDQPRFLRTGDVTFLADNEPVLALEIDGDARAYPVQVLTWHEIVNDTVGGIPVSVTYCPLCNSAVAYDRRLDGSQGPEVLDFGTSGLLWNSALVMYDRQTETLWSHFTGQGIVGELTGVQLTDFPVTTVAWSAWRDAHPDGLVLSRDTGFNRDYGRNPYPGYDDVDGIPFLFQGEVDGRYTAMTRIVGVEDDGDAFGIPLVDLQEHEVIATEFGQRPVVAWWTPGTSSALDSADIASGSDVGTTGVFISETDGTELTFRVDAGEFVDDQTGSTWDVFGLAVDGPLAGAQLEAISHVDTFWFAWSTFRPDTAIITG